MKLTIVSPQAQLGRYGLEQREAWVKRASATFLVCALFHGIRNAGRPQQGFLLLSSRSVIPEPMERPAWRRLHTVLGTALVSAAPSPRRQNKAAHVHRESFP